MRNILIVDDSDADQYICAEIFEENYPDVNILQAFDGEEALNLLDENGGQVDLILLDVNMPRMNGHEFLEEYQNRPYADNNTLILMLTSSAQEKDKEMCLKYNFVKDYILKPMDVDDLSYYLDAV